LKALCGLISLRKSKIRRIRIEWHGFCFSILEHFHAMEASMEAINHIGFLTEDRAGRLDAYRPSPTEPWSFNENSFRTGQWSLDASYRYCRNLAKNHYENFPVVFSLIDRARRDAISAVYAFARTADDFADEAVFEGMRMRLLDDWQNQLQRCFEGMAEHPIFVALGDAIRRFDLSRQPFLDLLDAFREDCVRRRWDTFDSLLDYCRRSANPVGRIVLKIFGIDTVELAMYSDRICTALQLANFWQDISVDLKKNRIYLPLEDLNRYRVSVGSLFSGAVNDSFADLMRFEIERTDRLFKDGAALIDRTEFPWSAFFAAVCSGGRTILRMTAERGASILYRRPSLNALHVTAGLYKNFRRRPYFIGPMQ